MMMKVMEKALSLLLTMKHGVVEVKNQTESDIVSVSESDASDCELGPESAKKRCSAGSGQRAIHLCSTTEEVGSDLP